MTNATIQDAIRNHRRVYAVLSDSRRDTIYAIGWTKAIGRDRHYQLSEIKGFVIE
jgi:hypothetical protein